MRFHPGTAIEAKAPITTRTTIISINVKPEKE
jgi:hypothetical protein